MSPKYHFPNRQNPVCDQCNSANPNPKVPRNSPVSPRPHRPPPRAHLSGPGDSKGPHQPRFQLLEDKLKVKAKPFILPFEIKSHLLLGIREKQESLVFEECWTTGFGWINMYQACVERSDKNSLHPSWF